MKRVLALALVAILLLGGCGGKEENGNKSESIKTPENYIGNGIRLNGVYVDIGGELTADMLKKLGEPSEKTESPNCVYEGVVYDYIYAGFSLQVNQQESKNTLLKVTITDPAYKTDKGVKIGDTAGAVKQAYGEATEDTKYYIVYTIDNMDLTFNLESDAVSEIEYAAIQ